MRIKSFPTLCEAVSSIPSTARTSSSSPGEVKVGGLEIQGHPQVLYRGFKASLGSLRPRFNGKSVQVRVWLSDIILT